MLFVMNTIKDTSAAERFDALISEIYAMKKYGIYHLSDLPIKVDLTKYTHLLLSGSELSASQGSEFDDDLIELINHFIAKDKSIYGICHGHQMIARTILGSTACRRVDIPEFGWHKMATEKDELFDGLVNPVFAQSHYDEVCNLTVDFEILASTNECKVQAYRVTGKRIWGTQFHPEMSYEAGEKMRLENLESEDAAKELSKNELIDRGQLKQNWRIFHNFY